jgi:hypothetical protein
MAENPDIGPADGTPGPPNPGAAAHRSILDRLVELQDRGLLRFSCQLIFIQVLMVAVLLPVAAIVNYVAIQAGVVGTDPGPDIVQEFGFRQAFLLAVLIGPMIETILFQVLFIEVLRAFGANHKVQLAVSASLFMVAHFSNSLMSGLVAGISGGLIFGVAYIVGRQRSFGRALFGTYLTHALWNAGVLGLAYVLLTIFGS